MSAQRDPGAPLSEKRREPRQPASGSVRLRIDDPRQLDIEGALVDLSVDGFRMSHTCASLETGAIVEFHFRGTAGHARVMWNRVLGSGIESGFLIL